MAKVQGNRNLLRGFSDRQAIKWFRLKINNCQLQYKIAS